MLFASGVWLAPEVASAQREVTDEERAAARTLAQTGVTAFQEQRYPDAVSALERAEELIHSPVHLLFIARASERQGQLVKAHEAYVKVTQEQLNESSPAAFVSAVEQATAELAALKPRIPKLLVRVTAPEGVQPQLSLDGALVSDALIGVPWPVDPGEHTVMAQAEGMQPASQPFTLAESVQQEIELALAPIAVAQATPAQADVAPVAQVQPRDDTMLYVAYGAIGVGVVGTALGTVMLIDGLGSTSDSDDLFERCNPDGCSDDEIDEVDRLGEDGASALTWSAVGYAVGGVGIAAGVTLLVLEMNDTSEGAETTARPRVVPWVSTNSIGVSGTF